MNKTPAGPTVRWVIDLSDVGSLSRLECEWDEHPGPNENEIITRPFLVDSVSKQPVPVRVIQRVEFPHAEDPIAVVVVTRSP